MTGWALDLGTTNTGLARWDDARGQPQLVDLPAICRKPDGREALEAPRLVPSALDLVERPRLLDRLGAWPAVARRFFLGRQAFVGRLALERNHSLMRPTFVPTFKPALSSDPLLPLARAGPRSVTAREAAQAFLRELLVEVKRHTGHRLRELVVTSPVTAFESYRAEVQEILKRLPDLRVAAARALGRVGTAAAVVPLKEAEGRAAESTFTRAVRQAIAEIQARLPGASPGQLSIASGESGTLSLVEDERGRLSLPGPGAED